MKKCLVVFNDENYILFLNGNRIDHLLDAIKKKKELYNLLLFNFKVHEFLVSFIQLNGHMDTL